MVRIVSFLVIAATTFSVCTAATLQPAAASRPAQLGAGDHTRRIELQGRDRSYLIHIPPSYNPRRATPVVLIYHGAAMNAQLMVFFSGLNRKADEAEFIAVYPNGTGLGEAILTFNAFDMPRWTNRVDDVDFTRRLLDDLASVVHVDPRRVYATGMSNGGMMCYRLAAELSDRIAAIAPVAGTLAIELCQPKRPVPVVHFHGRADGIVPFDGPGPKTPQFIKFKSVDQTIRTFVAINGCPERPTVSDLPDVKKDGTTVRRSVWGPGRDGAEVVLYTVEGGGHTWPGRQAHVGFLGLSTFDIQANDLIWEFFRKHPMK